MWNNFHLQAKHSLVYACKKSKNSEEPCTLKQISLDIFLKQCNEATTIMERIFTIIAIDLKPIHMVEGKGFLKLIDYFEPK